MYDSETGLYYLQSRYYDPEIGRFISPDSQISGVGGETLGYNQFAYCFNNPVNAEDSSGNWPKWAGVIAAVAAAAIAVATVVAVAPAAVCSLTMMAVCAGVNYGAAHLLAVGVVAVTSVAATAFAADSAYASVTGESPLKETVFNGNEEAYNAAATLTSIATAGMVQASSFSPGVCFVAGTLVATEDGSSPIENITVGDKVWAWNEETGEVALKPVVETYVNKANELIHVFVNGEEIITTPEHPFYSPVKGWTKSAKLRAGDILVLLNGEYVVVEKIQHEILESPITVYNFQVNDYHTYYVSNAGVLVHNSCNHNNTWAKERKTFWKNEAKTAVPNQDYGAYIATEENITRMSKGLAPIGWDGYSVQLHHWKGILNDFYDYSPVSRTFHQTIHLFGGRT